jgi:uncharacterized protein YcfJ
MRNIMKRTVAAAAAMVGLLLTQAACAQVTFYEHEGMRGRSFTAAGPLENFEYYGFNDRGSSVVVQRGRWEVCEDAYFRGYCVVLSPGQYPSLAAMGMNNRISSIRPVRGQPVQAYVPPPPVPAPYPYYPQHGETLYPANVVAVRAVMGPPEQRCWVEHEQVAQGGSPNVPGAIIGGILGGVLGHQIGGGRGNDVATAIGAVGGAALGANVNRAGPQTYTQDVQKCASVPGSERPAYWDVTYVFRGVTHRAQLAHAPGATITVNVRGEPRM